MISALTSWQIFVLWTNSANPLGNYRHIFVMTPYQNSLNQTNAFLRFKLAVTHLLKTLAIMPVLPSHVFAIWFIFICIFLNNKTFPFLYCSSRGDHRFRLYFSNSSLLIIFLNLPTGCTLPAGRSPRQHPWHIILGWTYCAASTQNHWPETGFTFKQHALDSPSFAFNANWFIRNFRQVYLFLRIPKAAEMDKIL